MNGTLIPGPSGTLEGRIATLTVVQYITLKINPEHKPDNPDSPKYRIFAKARTGDEVGIGAAWEKVMEKGPTPGAKMLAMTIDDPSFTTTLHVTAFPRDGGKFEIVWRRSRAVDPSTFQPDPGRQR